MNHRWVGLKLDKFKHVAITTRRHGINFTMGFHIFDYDPVLGRKKMMKFSRPLMFCCDAVACSDAPKRLETRTSSPSCASWGNIGLRQIQARFQHRGSGWCLKSSDLAAEIIFDFIYIWLYIIILCTYKIYVCICFHVCFWWRHQKYMLMEQLFAATMCGWLRNIHATMETLDSH